MQAAGQVPQSVVNPSSSHLQGTKYARPKHGDPMEAVRAAAAVINATLAVKQPGQSKSALTTPALTRQARRLYVGNIPFGCTDEDLIEFFRSNMEACNFIKGSGNPVVACQINLDKNFAFLEFRTIEETTSAMVLDGILCKGQALKIRRPHDYQPVPGSEPAPTRLDSSSSGATGFMAQANKHESKGHASGLISTSVADSPNKIYVGGIPTYLTDEQIKEILASFGTLKAFNLIRDPTTLASKGYAFCEYADSTITDQAILGLNGFEIGDKKLVVQRASVGSKAGVATGGASLGPGLSGNLSGSTLPLAAAPAISAMAPVQIQVPGMPSITQATSAPRVLTEILCLLNMVDPEQLRDDQVYEEIIEDIVEECRKYGRLRSIEIPRPRKDGSHVAGLGKVFVEFDSATEAQRAQLNLAGRRFDNRIVVTSYFDRDRYRNKEF